MGRRVARTEKLELVETHNIALAITRLRMNCYDDRWKRALYHAAAIGGVGSGELQKLRVALELP